MPHAKYTSLGSLKTIGLQIGLVICWSSGFIGALFASETSSIYLVLLWRFLLAAVFLTPSLIPFIKLTNLKHLTQHMLVGTLAMFVNLAALVTAVDLGVPAGTAALIASLQPLVVSSKKVVHSF